MKFDVINTTHQKKALASVHIGERVIIPPESEDLYDLDPSVATINLPGVSITPAKMAQKEPVSTAGPIDPPVKPTPAPTAVKPAPLPPSKAPITPAKPAVVAPVVAAPVKAPAGAPPAPAAVPAAPTGVVSEGLASWQKGLEAPK